MGAVKVTNLVIKPETPLGLIFGVSSDRDEDMVRYRHVYAKCCLKAMDTFHGPYFHFYLELALET